MKTNLTMPKISILFSILALLCSVNVYAQPANDDCSTAAAITIGADAGSATLESGTTLSATASNTPTQVCTASRFEDDVWYSITTPATLPTDQLLKIQVFFGNMAGDLPTIGAAFYEGCESGMPAIYCFTDADGSNDKMSIYTSNLAVNTTYYIRVCSGGSPTDDSGSFRIGAWWEPMIEDVVLWGANPGEGDFDGGFNGWTEQSINGDTSTWRYEPDSRSNGSFRRATISSPTAFNGAMVFDADSMNTVFGAPPGPPYPQLVGELISPVIDGSNFDAVSLKFYSSYAPLNGNAFFAVSTDGGASWSPDVEVGEEVSPNSYAEIGGFRRYFLPELANQSQIRVKFTFSGDFYYWIVDDIQLIEPEDNNLVVMENFYAIAPNAMWPASQVEEFGFLADVANVGAADQPNTNLNMTIIDNTTSAQVFSADLSYGTIPADSLVENQPFIGANDCFLPDGSITTYTGTYTISSDSVEFDPSDNQRSFTFAVSDTVFAKESGVTRTVVPAGANWDDGEAHSWAYGNFFHIVNGSDAADPDNQWYASSATFGIGNPADLVGRPITVFLYQWTSDANNDQNMDPGERTAVGFASYLISGMETPNELITLDLEPFPMGTGLVSIASGGDYVLMVEYQTSDSDVDMAMSGAEPWDYAAQQFRTDPNEFGDKPFRAGEMLGIGGDLTAEPYSSAGFTGGVTPTIRLNIAQDETINVVILDDENIVKVSPNPASDFINLNIDLVNTQENVLVRITDITGRVMLQTSYDNVSKETFNYDVSQFAAGAYFLNLSTEEGTRTERFIIQR